MTPRLFLTEMQRFCMKDGPCIRTTVFFKGCPLRCRWCHNPETQSAEQQILYYADACIGCGACRNVCAASAHRLDGGHIYQRDLCVGCGRCADVCPTAALALAGKSMSVQAALDVILRDRAFYGDDGGVTLSGGEPLAQAEGALALLAACKAAGIGTAVETCGYFPAAVLPDLRGCADLLLWDIKDTDPARHIRYTGVSNARILDNLHRADRLGIPTLLRCILVNGVNTDETHYRAVAALAASLDNCRGVEWLPYHAYGGAKCVPLGRPDNGCTAMIPTAEQLNAARRYTESFADT